MASLRILVVDDHLSAAESLAEWLRCLGHEVRIAEDGPSALALSESFHPALVILDIQMPSMDGYETARRLRRSMANDQVFIAALSGSWISSSPGLVDRFDAHFVKPIEGAQVAQLIERAARGAPARPALRPGRAVDGSGRRSAGAWQAASG
jgi:CheY-like chemotaxis protein